MSASRQRRASLQSMRLYAAISAWTHVRNSTNTSQRLSVAKEIILHMGELKRYDEMKQFVDCLDSALFVQLQTYSEVFRQFTEMYMAKCDFKQAFRLIEESCVPGEDSYHWLLTLWDETHYREREYTLNQSLTPLARFRTRKRNPPPPNICPGGVRPVCSLPELAKIVLWTWLDKHANNPYPTKAQKYRLADQTGLSNAQVNNWFANVRRRMKKVGGWMLLDRKRKYCTEMAAGGNQPQVTQCEMGSSTTLTNSGSASEPILDHPYCDRRPICTSSPLLPPTEGATHPFADVEGKEEDVWTAYLGLQQLRGAHDLVRVQAEATVQAHIMAMAQAQALAQVKAEAMAQAQSEDVAEVRVPGLAQARGTDQALCAEASAQVEAKPRVQSPSRETALAHTAQNTPINYESGVKGEPLPAAEAQAHIHPQVQSPVGLQTPVTPRAGWLAGAYPGWGSNHREMLPPPPSSPLCPTPNSVTDYSYFQYSSPDQMVPDTQSVALAADRSLGRNWCQVCPSYPLGSNVAYLGESPYPASLHPTSSPLLTNGTRQCRNNATLAEQVGSMPEFPAQLLHGANKTNVTSFPQLPEHPHSPPASSIGKPGELALTLRQILRRPPLTSETVRRSPEVSARRCHQFPALYEPISPASEDDSKSEEIDTFWSTDLAKAKHLTTTGNVPVLKTENSSVWHMAQDPHSPVTLTLTDGHSCLSSAGERNNPVMASTGRRQQVCSYRDAMSHLQDPAPKSQCRPQAACADMTAPSPLAAYVPMVVSRTVETDYRQTAGMLQVREHNYTQVGNVALHFPYGGDALTISPHSAATRAVATYTWLPLVPPGGRYQNNCATPGGWSGNPTSAQQSPRTLQQDLLTGYGGSSMWGAGSVSAGQSPCPDPYPRAPGIPQRDNFTSPTVNQRAPPFMSTLPVSPPGYNQVVPTHLGPTAVSPLQRFSVQNKSQATHCYRNLQQIQPVRCNLQQTQPTRCNLQQARPAHNLQQTQPARCNLQQARPARCNLQQPQAVRCDLQHTRPALCCLSQTRPAPYSLPSTSPTRYSLPSTPPAPYSLPSTSPAPYSLPSTSPTPYSLPSTPPAPYNLPSTPPAPYNLPSTPPAPYSLQQTQSTLCSVQQTQSAPNHLLPPLGGPHYLPQSRPASSYLPQTPPYSLQETNLAGHGDRPPRGISQPAPPGNGETETLPSQVVTSGLYRELASDDRPNCNVNIHQLQREQEVVQALLNLSQYSSSD